MIERMKGKTWNSPLETWAPLRRFCLFVLMEISSPRDRSNFHLEPGKWIPLRNEALMNGRGDQHRSSRWNSRTIVPAVTREDWMAGALDNL